MENPKIGYLVPQFPGQTHGFFWREILALEKMGAEVHIFSTRRPPLGMIAHEWSQEAIKRTTYLSTINPWQLFAICSPRSVGIFQGRRAPSIRQALPMLPYAHKLARLCELKGIQHLHVHSCGRAALIAALVNRLTDISYSLTLHGQINDYGSDQPFKWRHAKFCIVVTDTLENEIRQALGNDLPARIVVQAMGVDTDFFRRSMPYNPFSGLGPLKIFSCGRLNIGKGHIEHLHAIKELLNSGLNVELRIAGEDDVGGAGFRKQIETEILRLGLDESVTLLGAVDARTIREHILNAHLFVLASRNEAIGVAYMEAMSCEVPTIGTDVGGVSELINSGFDGILVPANNSKLLASAIRDLASNPILAWELARNGRVRVVKKFSSRLSAETLFKEMIRSSS